VVSTGSGEGKVFLTYSIKLKPFAEIKEFRQQP
jgi:hypothetical protein